MQQQQRGIIENKMEELTKHKAYEMLKTTYKECLLDYVILLCDEEYFGQITHKKAVIKAFEIINARFQGAGRYPYLLIIAEEQMTALKCDMDRFLELPESKCYKTKELKKSRSYIQIPEVLPYWFAFLDPPYPNSYILSDFIKLNKVLFPFPDSCEVYRWKDDFSDYFEMGKEWWGTGCWSIYDSVTKIFVVIGASLTD